MKLYKESLDKKYVYLHFKLNSIAMGNLAVLGIKPESYARYANSLLPSYTPALNSCYLYSY